MTSWCATWSVPTARTGAVAVDDRVPLGSTVRFHLRDAETADGDLPIAAERPTGRRPPFFSLATDAAPGSLTGRPRCPDFATIGSAPCPLAGFFAAGEIGPVGGQNFVHGFTASMALFREQ